jgi:hypothetical protein
MAIARNSIVAPFSVNSPLLESSKSTMIMKGGKPAQSGNSSASAPVAITHQKWFQSVANGINASVQISTVVPAHSNSDGEPGTIVLFAGGFYLCVGSNNWLKFVGAPF